jgi:cytoskeletal protein CcmA (bactofilin family)
MWFKQGTKQGEQPPSRRAAPSILSSDLRIDGNIVSQGELHIGGSVKGDVAARDLRLSEGGSVTGTIEADIAVIAGNLAGRLTATAVVLERTAHLAAEVTHVSLTIEPGATFEGVSRRVDTVEAVIHTPRLNAPASSEAKPV